MRTFHFRSSDWEVPAGVGLKVPSWRDCPVGAGLLSGGENPPRWWGKSHHPWGTVIQPCWRVCSEAPSSSAGDGGYSGRGGIIFGSTCTCGGVPGPCIPSCEGRSIGQLDGTGGDKATLRLDVNGSSSWVTHATNSTGSPQQFVTGGSDAEPNRS